MPRLLRQPVAVSGGAGAGVALSAGGKDHPGSEIAALRRCCSGNASVFDQKSGDRLMAALYPRPFHIPLQGRNHVPCPIRHREHPVPPLGFQGNAHGLKGRHDPLRREPIHHRVEKARVGGDVFQDIFGGAVIGDIAPPLAGDGELPAQPLRLLQQQYAGAGKSGGSR